MEELDLEMVEMTHPDIDGGKRVVPVPRVAFEHHHARAGWELVDDEAAADAAEPDAPPSGEPAKTQALEHQPGADTDKPTARRRASSKEEGAE
ncbi:hypothetical protein [Sphaerisporangium sp. TRM90804]|uniref:hypothetical protein n=1 Tax=Sphaerisporangium sp. TRM90804 TaxID=3031113 RepID=UPI00244CA67C|nr:hypothetical protein [Sphaerisporangium sp. TRM90804]MDH2429316.1 hypothetical protein [Sphaerisporangium sp. TRM90804]